MFTCKQHGVSKRCRGHSDADNQRQAYYTIPRESQYASREYREHLVVMGMTQSRFVRAIVGIICPPSGSFGSLKYEPLNDEKLSSQEQARLSGVDDLAFFNGRRQWPMTSLDIGLSIPERIRTRIFLILLNSKCPVWIDHYNRDGGPSLAKAGGV